MKQIIIKLGKAKPFFKGEPLIFSGAIEHAVGDIKPAELVEVLASDKKFIGIGIFNPYSNYRVRLLTFSNEKIEPNLNAIILHRLKTAIDRRKKLDLPNPNTNIFRLVNSEADRLSGLIVDVASGIAIVSVTAYWVMAYRDLIESCLKTLGFKEIIWRGQTSALAQDGWKEEIKAIETETLVTVKENGLLFQVDLGQGQKTGFYCDQRDNRLVVRQYAADKNVLDCFCYTGGFSLNAAMGGAKHVTGLDSSASAIALAKTNAVLNKLQHIEFRVDKAEDYLLAHNSEFDFIILDPPKLAPTEKSLQRAKQKYIKLNELAMRALLPNGLLLTCSCSNALTEEVFVSLLKVAAKKAGRGLSIIRKMHASPDHPFLEKSKYGNYLKVILASIQ